MLNLYFTSLTPGAGKTALASACVASLIAQGKKARYYKPLSVKTADQDAAFCQDVFGDAAGPAAQLVPKESLQAAIVAHGPTIQKTSQALGAGARLCMDGLDAGDETATHAAEVARLTGAQVIGVVRYQRGMNLAPVLGLRQVFGVQLKGVILNAVPSTSLRIAAEGFTLALEAGGVPVLGIIPEDRLLLSFTVAEYSVRLGGQILNNAEHAGRIVESLLVGANAVDQGELYYSTAENKALITRGDRPDLQFSALNTSTRCLILTNGVSPIPYVLDQAMEQEVPIVVVPMGTLATIEAIEGFIAQSNFHHRDKLARAVQLWDAHVGKRAVE